MTVKAHYAHLASTIRHDEQALEKKREQLRGLVVGEIKKLIVQHMLKASDLFTNGKAERFPRAYGEKEKLVVSKAFKKLAKKAPVKAKRAKRMGAKPGKRAIKYVWEGKGWSGWARAPGWYNDAIKAGITPEQMMAEAAKA